MKKTILAIETSCDDTGLAVVQAEGGFSEPKFKVLENLVSSQIKIHRPFGGVVPNLAKREHIKNLPILYKKLLATNYKLLSTIDLIAVTVGPGLEPALWTGITFAEELSRKTKKPLIGANHLEGHLYSFLLLKKTASSRFKVPRLRQGFGGQESSKSMFPAIALLVSGGHTALLLMKNLKEWKILGETRDDAAGEAFDKVARMLKLPYPGGPEIERLALSMPKGEKPSINFPKPMLNQKNYDFSFSGLKTSVFYFLREQKIKGIMDNESRIKGKKSIIHNSQFTIQDVAASFQKTVIEVLARKTERAAVEFSTRSIILCGGVAANKVLRKELKRTADGLGINFFVPEMEYNNDNAAMIAAAGYFAYLKGKKSAQSGSALGGLPLKADGDLNI